MTAALLPLVGREHELFALDDALAQSEGGVGGLWLVVGEAGIGKSRLLEDVARRAEARGAIVAIGRAWESGGAPAFWPWVIVLRTIMRRRGRAWLDPHRAAMLSQILPELADRNTATSDGPPSLAPHEARFRLLDAVVGVLLEAAEGGALCILLEDLHAADASSLLVLELLAAQIRSAPVVVVASHREVAAAQGPVASQLLQLARVARTLPLRRLQRDEVASYLAEVLPRAPTAALVDSLCAACEGNPLFMVELSRWVAAGHDGLVIPTTLRAVIRERCDAAPQDVRTVLERAAVLGRQFDAAVLVAVLEGEPQPQVAIDGALAAGLLEPAGAHGLRFSHVLVREVIYADIAEPTRAALHLRAADACLACATGPEPPWSELAHHLELAGPPARARAVEAAVCAAERASTQFAFVEAAQWLTRALDRLDDGGAVAPTRRAELLLLLGRARILAGDVQHGRKLCGEAAALAHTADEPGLFARAALEYGAVFVFGEVNDRLVALLREALTLVDDAGLRARLLARLAAAMQPAADPEVPIAMAREAVAAARAVGDPVVLLDVLRSAGSALADLAPPRERRLVDREHLALAERLGDPAEALRGGQRLVFDALEVGNAAEAEAAVEACERIALHIGMPHALWRAAAVRAVLELFRGRVSEATHEWARALSLARQARDPNAERSLGLQRALALGLAGRRREGRAAVAPVRMMLTDHNFGQFLCDTCEALLCDEGSEERIIEPSVVAAALGGADLSLQWCAGELAILAGDRTTARAVLDRLESQPGRFANFGMSAPFVGAPFELAVAKLHSFLGEDVRAREAFVRARERAGAAGAQAQCAWTDWEHARHLARVEPAAHARRRELLTAALAGAVTLGLDGLSEQIAAAAAELPSLPTDAAPVAAPVVSAVRADVARGPSLRRLGDVWELADGDDLVHLRDTRGMHILARLMDAPGQPIHALDLAVEKDGTVDVGDAGPMIDAHARDAYRERLVELREELGEAEAWNDAGRTAGLREEVEQIEAELARSVGLGGRLRRSNAASERARVNVQRRLRDVLRRIAAVRPELARRLERSVRTGTSCVYEP